MSTRRTSLVILGGLVLLSLNLRPAAVSVGPVLAEVRSALGMSPVAAGLLTSLPVLAFAFFGALAPTAARRVGVHRVTLLALVAAVVGLAGRAVTSSEALFLALSMLALGGMAMANVLLPSLVKLHFPDAVGRVTAIYTTALAVGLTTSLLLTVPVSHAGGSWRWGLGIWAGLALLAALPWVGLVAHDRALDQAPRSIGWADVARTRLGWAMALFFGLQSMQAYAVFGWFAQLWRDHGYTAGQAGALVGLLAAVSIPLSLWAPAAVARRTDQARILLAIMLCYPVGYVGLMIAPHAFAIPGALLVGIGAVTFPIVLVLIGLRARTPEGTAALSSFTQSTGYLLAALGPFGVGTLYDATGGWTAPLLMLTALMVPQIAAGLYVARPAAIEDQLPGSRTISDVAGSKPPRR
ncbi:CP family cyanate transporter-like MFS transporter [Nocardioides ginsengisegetis]|uniref:CP family cyanate transporter-like MFS transporter n=1 Tax=Nocardioides ginsengisegetis TaxID=661491 RepID=A0A7W3PA93_9ACTN|nr:CP family cyanate transporter-like MFS transporter [Nocardioides ginsengisegetis]